MRPPRLPTAFVVDLDNGMPYRFCVGVEAVDRDAPLGADTGPSNAEFIAESPSSIFQLETLLHSFLTNQKLLSFVLKFKPFLLFRFLVIVFGFTNAEEGWIFTDGSRLIRSPERTKGAFRISGSVKRP